MVFVAIENIALIRQKFVISPKILIENHPKRIHRRNRLIHTGVILIWKIDSVQYTISCFNFEWFGVCGLSPDRQHMVYLGVGGRVKKEGRIYHSGRSVLLFPLMEDSPAFERLTIFEETWEGCPAWQFER